VYLDFEEREPVVEVGHVREFAAEPVNRLADHGVEASGFGVREETLKSGPKPAGTAYRAVIIHSGLGPTVLPDVSSADLNLILDRGLALVLGAVSGVNHRARCHSCCSPVSAATR
jgi:hypothetical protein